LNETPTKLERRLPADVAELLKRREEPVAEL